MAECLQRKTFVAIKSRCAISGCVVTFLEGWIFKESLEATFEQVGVSIFNIFSDESKFHSLPPSL